MSLIKDSVVYLFSELFAKALPFLLLPYLARKLGVADFGILSYWQTIFAVLVVSIGISQDGAIARYHYVYGVRNLPALLTSSFIYTLVIALFFLIIAVAMRSLILFSVVLAATSQALLNIQLALRQCRKQAKAYGIIQIGAGLATTALTLILLELTHNWLIEKRFLAIFVGNAILCCLCWYFAQQNFALPVSRRHFKLNLLYLLGLGLPLMAHNFSLLAKGQLDRIVLYHHYPADQLGVYAAAFQIASALPILLLAINKAYIPYYFEALKTSRLALPQVQRHTLIALALSPLPVLLSAIVPENLYLIVFGQDFTGIRHITLAFLFGFGLNMPYLILVNYLFYHGQNARISRNSIQAAFLYLIILWWVLPLGIKWTPLAMIAANLLILPLLWRECSHCSIKAT